MVEFIWELALGVLVPVANKVDFVSCGLEKCWVIVPLKAGILCL